MDWINAIIGLCLIILGLLWLVYQSDKTKKYKKDESYVQLSTQPSQYIGILILVLGGIVMIYRAF